MTFPDYATVEKKFVTEDLNTNVECSHFMVLLQGYKVKVGFKVHRSRQKSDGRRIVNYSFERYGWSNSLLKWRSKEFRQKVGYLENFFQNAEKYKIDEFLFKEKNVIVEKIHEWPESPSSPLKFAR
jgi:hypothetical protein